jgi:hypothetical protein
VNSGRMSGGNEGDDMDPRAHPAGSGAHVPPAVPQEMLQALCNELLPRLLDGLAQQNSASHRSPVHGTPLSLNRSSERDRLRGNGAENAPDGQAVMAQLHDILAAMRKSFADKRAIGTVKQT